MVLTAGGDFPAINQGCVAHHGDIIYEVGGQAHVVGNHPQTCSHRRERGVVGPDNGGVMLRQRRDARIGVVVRRPNPVAQAGRSLPRILLPQSRTIRRKPDLQSWRLTTVAATVSAMSAGAQRPSSSCWASPST